MLKNDFTNVDILHRAAMIKRPQWDKNLSVIDKSIEVKI